MAQAQGQGPQGQNQGQPKSEALKGAGLDISNVSGLTSVQGAAKKAAEGSTDLLARGQEIASNLANRAKGYGTDATSMVKEYPLQSLLVGFGLGCLAGVLISRR